jgi:hypothetical protein
MELKGSPAEQGERKVRSEKEERELELEDVLGEGMEICLAGEASRLELEQVARVGMALRNSRAGSWDSEDERLLVAVRAESGAEFVWGEGNWDLGSGREQVTQMLAELLLEQIGWQA